MNELLGVQGEDSMHRRLDNTAAKRAKSQARLKSTGLFWHRILLFLAKQFRVDIGSYG